MGNSREKYTDAHDDKVNPKHYADLGEYSAVYIIRRWNDFRKKLQANHNPVELIGFNVGNALKYIQRAGIKPGEGEIVDLKKAIWYLKNRIHEIDPNEEDPAA